MEKSAVEIGGCKMKAKEVLVLLTDQWADWEAAYAIPLINSVPQYTIKTIATNKVSKVSSGGLRVEIDYTLDSYHDFDNLAMLILPGGFTWKEERHDKIAAFVKKVIDVGRPVAAICGATIFLGKHELLDKVKHTGDDLEFFQKEQGYNGQDFYESAQIVVDSGMITANETAALEFARAILGMLEIGGDEDIDEWYKYFKHGMVK